MKANIDIPSKYSAIVLFEESDQDFPELIKTLNSVFVERTAPFEIIVVANGNGGLLQKEMERLPVQNNLRAFELSRKTSQAVCLKAGFDESDGDIIVVCGTHRQITHDSLIRLLDSLDDETDIVNSWRQDRRDSTFNQFQSRVYNTLLRKITKSDLHDLSSAMKVFRRQVMEETDIYGNMYRFLPILASQKGFRTKEVACRHYQWRGKTGFCSSSEYIERFVDIVTLYFVTQFARKPLRFFSLLGMLFLAVGVFATSYIFMEKLLFGQPIGGRPFLLIALFLMVIGVQVSSMGLLGEIIVFIHGRKKPHYTIEKTV